MASYEWVNLTGENGYDQLLGVLDPEYCPQVIVEKLKEQISGRVEGMLIEYGYVDKDYRSTFYNFYAKKGRHYRADCVRLHFFDGEVSYDKGCLDISSVDGRPQDHYFGYIVLRPTLVATLGRTVLSPDIRFGATGRVIQSSHHVNLLGRRLKVWGFPSMAQHIDIAVCAHVSCWAVLRYYSETFAQYQEHLIHDITKLTAPFDPGGLIPSLGINMLEAERVFQAVGCFPVLVAKAFSATEEAFFSQLLAYLESGFPLFVELPDEKHAVVLVGYVWRRSGASPGSSSLHVWHKVQSLLAVDDNLLPYSSVPLDNSSINPGVPSYTAKSINAFIVALPEKIYYPADVIDTFSKNIEMSLVNLRPPSSEPIHFRRYFMTTIAQLREHAQTNRSNLGNTLVGLMMCLKTAQFVWVVEFCSETQWKSGHIALRAIVDATASPEDPMTIWMLYDEDVAFVFDRSSANGNIDSIRLGRTNSVPLSRMEMNLRPIVGI